MFFVTLVHVLPLSRVSCTWPSLVPAQISPFSSRDSAIAITDERVLDADVVAGEPARKLLAGLVVGDRSGLITSQLWPRFVVRCTCWLPT